MRLRSTAISISLAISNLRTNVGRTLLTLVGVVIGITSVIVISSSGEGVKSFILGQIESFGSNVIQVETRVPSTTSTTTQESGSNHQSPGSVGVQITTLKLEDAEAILHLPNIEGVYTGTLGQEIVSNGPENKKALLFGASANAPFVDTNIKVKEGAFYTESDDKGRAPVVVIGADIKDALFGNNEAVGQNVKIKGQNYRVIGVLERRGTVTFFNFDELIYLPVQTLQKRIQGIDYIQFVSVKVKNGDVVEGTAEDIRQLMRTRHKISDPSKDDFSVMSIQETQEIISSVFGTINVLLLALTSISLIVGGVGIMNVMYVAVTERTFEIGLRKAVGASPASILRQFLFEAIFITLMGGIVGIILGLMFSWLFSYIFSLLGFDLRFVITWQSVFMATGFSVVTGIIFGYYPARRASHLSPMEAIRRE